MRIVCLSDTHGLCSGLSVPDGDVLLHSGDLTMEGSLDELKREADWLSGMPHPHKIIVCGNHDWCFEREASEARAIMRDRGLVYLEESFHDYGGLRFWGSPWTPYFWGWAFNAHRGEEIASHWAAIDERTDVLVTHGPPWGYGDYGRAGERLGCEELGLAVRRVNPKLHLFGHIHEGYGSYRCGDTVMINGSIVNGRYKMKNSPLIWESP